MRMAKRLDFGCVWINTHIPLVAEMPHGGFKKSGYGKDLSAYSFDDYTRIKHVMANLRSDLAVVSGSPGSRAPRLSELAMVPAVPPGNGKLRIIGR